MTVCELLAAVVLATAALLPSASNAISCYDCTYKNTTDAKDSKCSEPFNPSTTPKCDSQDMCFMKWTNDNSGYWVIRQCMNSSLGLTLDQCEMRGKLDNNAHFIYKKMCCYSTGKRVTPTSTDSTAECWCQTNNCNGDTPFPSDTTSPPTPNRSPITEMGPLYPILLSTVVAVIRATITL